MTSQDLQHPFQISHVIMNTAEYFKKYVNIKYST